MSQSEIENFIASLPNVEHEENMGYIFFFIGDNHLIPFATIGYADNVGDTVSNLNREGVFRLNLGVSKDYFEALFADNNHKAALDYTALDVFMPHPHYAAQGYICILNPSERHRDQVKNLITEAHALATRRHWLKQGK